MTLVPLFRSNNVARSVGFYTDTLDFTHRGTWSAGSGAGPDDPAFAIVERDGAELHLSSHSGDGKLGHALVVLVDSVDSLWARFVARGLDQSHRCESPVHLGPTDQSGGTCEFYVDDPDGNTLRFIQRRDQKL